MATQFGQVGKFLLRSCKLNLRNPVPSKKEDVRDTSTLAKNNNCICLRWSDNAGKNLENILRARFKWNDLKPVIVEYGEIYLIYTQ